MPYIPRSAPVVRRAGSTARIAVACGALSMAPLLILPPEDGSGRPVRVAPASPTDSLPPAPASTPGAGDTLRPVMLTAEDSLVAESLVEPVVLRRALEDYFARFSSDRVLVRRIARAVVREARSQNVAPSLVAAVLVTENTTLKPRATSSVGARGLMQVMPFHAGQLGCGSHDLVDVDSNICHGTKILARNLRTAKSPTRALLRYNGCVKGTNTPDCHRYPGRVLARAGRVRQEILAGVGVLPAIAPEPARTIAAGSVPSRGVRAAAIGSSTASHPVSD